ncbi:DUF2232 domain-containing protein [Methyloligella sp. 2.7D]|uniref:DUF2232 domain-containing protein n=1 Tax=unclassified Methyloligella TaxID=2625955 RepID=UPI00157C29DA|nr:DUF2232 domain-containing protein [Methyloligella sp. GL2]QKP77460.1 DUF2232 domain-containing protein [Methyloligella sp. GL2]
MRTSYLIGAGAGLVSSALFAAAATAAVFAGALLYLAPLPVCLAGLGWGASAAIAAAITGSLVLAFSFGPIVGLAFALVIGAPVAFLCHLLLLSRSTTQGELPQGELPVVEWYPIGRLVGWTAVVAGALGALMILILGYDLDALRESIRQMLQSDAFQQLDPDGTLFTPENAERLSDVLARALPAAFAIVWMTVTLFNLWIGGLISHASGRAMRPWPKLNAMEVPNVFFLAFVVTLILSFMPGMIGLVATGFAGALLLAFVLQGLAVIHAATQGMPMRGLLLAAIYAGIFLLGWVAIVIAIIGLAEPMLNLRARGGSNTKTD